MRAPATRLPAAQPAGRAPAPELQAKAPQDGIENLRPQAVAQRQLADFIRTSPRIVAQAKREAWLRGETVQRAGPEEEEMLQGKFEALQRTAPGEEELLQGKFAPAQLAGGGSEEELLQGKFAPVQSKGAESDREPRENKTGLPDSLKSGIESLSGISLDNVKVHYNSAQPAQLNALAYAQGTNIHVAPGQERHLPHEAWHIVQQKQGRVRATRQLKPGVLLNDDAGLEREADLVAATAAAAGPRAEGPDAELRPAADRTVQRCVDPDALVGNSNAERLAAFLNYAEAMAKKAQTRAEATLEDGGDDTSEYERWLKVSEDFVDITRFVNLSLSAPSPPSGSGSSSSSSSSSSSVAPDDGMKKAVDAIIDYINEANASYEKEKGGGGEAKEEKVKGKKSGKEEGDDEEEEKGEGSSSSRPYLPNRSYAARMGGKKAKGKGNLGATAKSKIIGICKEMKGLKQRMVSSSEDDLSPHLEWMGLYQQLCKYVDGLFDVDISQYMALLWNGTVNELNSVSAHADGGQTCNEELPKNILRCCGVSSQD